MHIVQAVIGILFILLLCWIMSSDKARFPWRFVLVGLALHLVLVLLFLKVTWIRDSFGFVGTLAEGLMQSTRQATSTVFGYIGGGPTPFEVTHAEANVVLAFQILPQIIVLSALFALLWHWGVLQRVIRGIALVLERFMQVSGALGLGAAANVFLGMIESPMAVRPFLAKMATAELFALMTCGMATISGTVMVLYGSVLTGVIDNPFSHIFIASLIAVPAALVLSRIVMPEISHLSPADLKGGTQYENAMDAISKGTQDGLQVFMSVLAMLIVIVALIALFNLVLGALLPTVGGEPLSMERILGWLFVPIAWCMGLPASEVVQGGALLGLKIILTEFVAFIEFSNLPEGTLSPRSAVIMTYALTGFANITSLGLLVGGLSAIVPERRADIMRLGPRSVITGALASCLSATVVGLVY